MENIKRYEIEWAGKPLVIEFGRYAGQANAACTVQYGETMILSTATMSPEARPGVSFFPLQVEFKENLYAAGKISGSRFIKREGRPTDESILSGRIIDRSIRPMFDQSHHRDIQVILNNLSYDPAANPDVVGLVGSVAAVMQSDIPFNGPMAGCIVSYKDGEYIINGGEEVTEVAEANVFVAGHNNEAVMIEADANEASEEVIYEAIERGLEALKPVNDLLLQIQQEIGKEKVVIEKAELSAEEEEVKKAAEAKAEAYYPTVREAVFGQGNKRERRERVNDAIAGLKAQFTDEDPDSAAGYAVKRFNALFSDDMIARIFEEGKRVDDRALDEIRPIAVGAGLVPRVHGSGMFERGDTQVLSIATLSAPSNEQLLDTMRRDTSLRYFHHYNFPPFSVGETAPMRGPGRREIGHGALAEKALIPVLPKKEDFPYVVRVVSEVLSSNGSSSQGSICGSTLALMDAGVPITAPVAGIAMGVALRTPGDKSDFRILTDMQDVEDYDESMDFKVGGTAKGITAIQLDIKLDGITMEMVKETLEKAKVARLELLEKMTAVIAEPRAELAATAPRIETISIPVDRIGELIGPGGKVIKGIIEETGAQIDIEEDGTVFVTADNAESMNKAKAMVTDIVKVIEVGEIYTGKVEKIVTDRNSGSEIGAIVSLTSNQDGMVHISEVENQRIAKVSDFMRVGEEVKVKVVSVDHEKGRIGLSRKALLKAEDPAAQ